MSILVDWAMPKACRDCALQIGGYCQMYSDESRRIDDVNLIVERPDWCPLVDIPTPHGRLIDADKLKSRLVLDNDSNELQRISADILKWIDIQETVIEGSET